jgi:hypothetical protein
MPDDPAILSFQSAILQAAEIKLGRPLTDVERGFITARRAFIALEAIWDTVRSEPRDDLERYLNSSP